MSIFFLHIPKTGGQTLATRLASAFPLDRVYMLKEEDLSGSEGSSKIKKIFKGHDFVESHISGSPLSGSRAYKIITAIRNPVFQIASSYRHMLRESRNNLHRAAMKLPVNIFFDNYIDYFANSQARYLVEAFGAPSLIVRARDYNKWLLDKLPKALEKIEWLVPTESLDDFCDLWSIESGLEMPYRDRVNVDISLDDIHPIIDSIERHAGDFSIDSLLWRESQRRHKTYRERVLASKDIYVNNAARAYAAGDSGIWLRQNWHAPIRHSDRGAEWLAGPRLLSRIDYRRTEHEKELSFTVAVLLGVALDHLHFYTPDDQRLPVSISPARAAGVATITLDISALPLEGHINVTVPEVMSPVQISVSDDRISRYSFGAHDWRLDGR